MLSLTPPVLNEGLLTLVVTGGSENSSVTVSETTLGVIQVEQVSLGETVRTTFPRGLVTSIQFFGGTGDETFVNATDIKLFATGGDGDDTLFGGSADDNLIGGDGDDILVGGAGDDRLTGGAGQDSLRGDAGDDLMFGGDDNDALSGGAGDDSAHGEQGDDYLDGGDGADYLDGGVGNDVAFAGAGADTIQGGAGDDQLVGGDDADRLTGGAGVDILIGGAGDDHLQGGDDGDLLLGGDGVDSLFGEDGNDRLEGDAGDDYLNGGIGNDVVLGGLGDDSLVGESGDDTLRGGAGADSLVGGNGRDLLFGEDGADTLRGGADDDQIYGGEGADNAYGDSGDDRIQGEGGVDFLDGGTGDDYILGGADADRIYGRDGVDSLHGGAGNDRISGGRHRDLIHGDDGADTLFGGDDNDLLYGDDGDDSLFGEAGDDRLEGDAGADFLEGGAGNDMLAGKGGDDSLVGGDGNDQLRGGDGNDRLDGDGGRDLLLGEAGDDLLFGGAERDLLYGGDGDDTAFGEGGNDRLEGDDGADFLDGGIGDDLLQGKRGDDSLVGGDGADNLRGGDGADRLTGNAGDDFLLGELGADELLGGDGDDFIHGGADNDTLIGDAGADNIDGGNGDDFADGGAGDDTIVGGRDNDTLSGGDGADTILGGDGDDHLSGGQGFDVLVGGAGDDNLNGNEDGDALLGGDGEDTLNAGDGRDLLIGGADIDTLLGEAGEDILIGGTTSYDDETLSLRAALAIWGGAAGYDARVAALSDEAGPVYFELYATVHDDLAVDRAYGGAGRDWFFLPGVNSVFNPLGVDDESGAHGGGHSHGMLVDTPPVLEGFAILGALDQLKDSESDEAITTLLPHSNDPSKLTEHVALYDLVQYADVTHTAVASGDWSDPSVWAYRQVPAAGAKVLIPYGAVVTVDTELAPAIDTVRVDGTLRFATDDDTQLRVDTLVVTATGALEIGTAEAPIEAGVSAQLSFTDTGAIDRDADPFALGRGLITHGSVEVHGAEKTSFVELKTSLNAGDDTLVLATVPAGWRVGDQLVIAGTAVGGGQDEVVTIRSIRGGNVYIDNQLSYDHAPLESGLTVHVANLTRNVVFESEGQAVDRLGHVMFMHNRDVHVSYAAFDNLGRSDKSVVVNDSQVDDQWRLVDGTGTNPRARYSVHFHRNGVRANSDPATVVGSVVNGSPGWGFVNHSSYVDFRDNVAYGVNGAAFVAEAGDEIGSFDGNIALNTTGTNEHTDSREFHQDFGFNGDGFWFQGAGVSVTNNIAAGSTGSAFIYYTRGLRFGTFETQFLAENLDDPQLAGGAATISVSHAPIKLFQNNTGYASDAGLNVRYHLRDATHSVQSVLSDSVFWSNKVGIDVPYTHNTILRDLTAIVSPEAFAGTGVDMNSVTKSITYDNLRVEGYFVGLTVPLKGQSIVSGGRYVNKFWNIAVRPSEDPNHSLIVRGAIDFGSIGGTFDGNVAMWFRTNNDAGNPTKVFTPSTVILQYGPYTNHRLYFREQAADAVPFPTQIGGLPSQYVGLTQAELWNQFGVAVGGQVAPAGAVNAGDLHGLVAPV